MNQLEKESFMKAVSKGGFANQGQRWWPGFTYCLFSVAILDLGSFVEEVNGQRIKLGKNEKYFRSDSKTADIRWSTGWLWSLFPFFFFLILTYIFSKEHRLQLLSQPFLFGFKSNYHSRLGSYYGKFKHLNHCTDTKGILNLLCILSSND